MKTCQKCMASINDDALFCPECGSKVEAQPQQRPQTPNEKNSFQSDQNNSSASMSSEQYNQNRSIYQNGNMYQQPFQPAQVDNSKTYCILSYIGILWLFGLLANPEKHDQRVRFNVGQGIIASIVSGGTLFIVGIINAILSAVFVTRYSLYGYSTYVDTNSTVVIITTLLWLAACAIAIFFMVYGIVKVSKNEDAFLPIIGKLAFYK